MMLTKVGVEMTGRTLLAYATKGGVTGENAEIIAGVLRDDFGHQVDVVNLMRARAPDIAPYDVVIIGSGVRVFRWYGKAKRLLKDKGLADKKVAIYLSSGMAGEDHDKAVSKFIDGVLAKYPHVRPVAAEAFGGRFPGGKAKMDFTDPEKVRAWAHELGEKLK
jgi:menaquinone-dependent protoporphyrinogen oxidase